MTKLRMKMIEDMNLKGLSILTQDAYVRQVKNLACYYNQSPEQLGENKVRKYLLYLKLEKKVSYSTFVLALSAIKFFYTVTLNRHWKVLEIVSPAKKKVLPIILSKEEIKNILESIENIKHRAIITTIYSGGLRIGEASRLKVIDIDSKRMVIRIEQSKNNKDRYVMLAQATLKILREYWKKYRPKFWLFPGKWPNRPIKSNSIYWVFRRACKLAKIRKHATVHTLRHSFATHLMEEGVHIRYIQTILGHKTPRTTMLYTPVDRNNILKIANPVDTL